MIVPSLYSDLLGNQGGKQACLSHTLGAALETELLGAALAYLTRSVL